MTNEESAAVQTPSERLPPFRVTSVGISYGLERANVGVVYSGFHTRAAAEIVGQSLNALERELAALREERDMREANVGYWRARAEEAERERDRRVDLDIYHEVLEMAHEAERELAVLRSYKALAVEAYEVLVGTGLGSRAPSITLDGGTGTWRENWCGRYDDLAATAAGPAGEEGST